MTASRSSYAHKRPAPRNATGAPPRITDDVDWTRIVDPPEIYTVVYVDRHNVRTTRTITLRKIGHSKDIEYLSVTDEGKSKTFRRDRIVDVLAQVTTGHAPSLSPQPTYSTDLPSFPLPGAVYRMPTTTAGNRTWTVDLNAYICTCPEKRIRSAMGYTPGKLGYCCDHMAKAILAHLPADAPGWTPELRAFLSDGRRMHIDNLV